MDDDNEFDDCNDAFVLDEDSPESEPCMGEGCINPHPDHSYSECYTLEMCEAENQQPPITQYRRVVVKIEDSRSNGEFHAPTAEDLPHILRAIPREVMEKEGWTLAAKLSGTVPKNCGSWCKSWERCGKPEHNRCDCFVVAESVKVHAGTFAALAAAVDTVSERVDCTSIPAALAELYRAARKVVGK